MNQRVCVNHLNSSHKRRNQFHICSAHSPVSLHHQNGTDPLASGIDTVIHGLKNGFVKSLFLWKIFAERVGIYLMIHLDDRYLFGEVFQLAYIP